MTRINTNVTSMVSARILNQQSTAMNKSLERLSTGLRINRGSDDPAGLIASELLRGQKTAISAAISNGERAANIIATSEAALNEVSSLLVKLEGLVSSANNEAGLTDEELQAKQTEVDNILDSINRIADSTSFGTQKLLNGSMDFTMTGTPTGSEVEVRSAKLAPGATRDVVVAVTQSAQYGAVQTSGATSTISVTLEVTGSLGTERFTFASNTTSADIRDAINATSDFTGVCAILSTDLYFKTAKYGADEFVKVDVLQAGGTWTVDGAASSKQTGQNAKATINGSSVTSDGLELSLNSSSLSIHMEMTAAQLANGQNHSMTITGGGAMFSLTPDGITGRIGLGLPSLSVSNLGNLADGKISDLGSGQANSLNSGNGPESLNIVNAAIKQVASLRGRLGAFQQNTVESGINSMNVALENITSAESAIRDTDFATETARLTRSQILVNSATNMLSRATSAPQNALMLLG